MAQPTNTFDTYDAVGNREDLADVIYNISPTDTPGMTAMGRGKSKAIYHEWQTDSLAAPDGNNAHIDGDDAVGDALTPTTRVGNTNQILRKVVVVSGTQDAVDKAGRKKETAYQIAKKAKELKRDIETIVCGNQSSVAGSSVLARRMGSVEAWLTTNVSRGTGGTSGGFSGGTVTAATDGTQRALTESLAKDVIHQAWTQGGDINLIMVGGKNKQTISGWTGRADHQNNESAGSKKLTNVVDVYVSDFGEHRVVANRFSRDRTALFLDTSLWKLCYLRPFQQSPLAKTGDSEKRLMLAELTVRCNQEAGNGVVADLLTS